jgi:hypothetical protein
VHCILVLQVWQLPGQSFGHEVEFEQLLVLEGKEGKRVNIESIMTTDADD